MHAGPRRRTLEVLHVHRAAIGMRDERITAEEAATAAAAVIEAEAAARARVSKGGGGEDLPPACAGICDFCLARCG